MLLWIEDHSYEPTDFEAIHALSLDRPWLVPVLAFLRFWLSDQSEWRAQTSGSTSAPKTISISRSKIEGSASATVRYFSLMPETDGLILCLSAQHVGGFMVLARGLLAGLDVWILEPSSNPIPERSVLLKFRSWFISVVPMQLAAISNSENLLKESINWKGLLLGGAALSSTHIKQAQAFRCPVYQSYGMTETVSHIAVRQIRPDFSNETPYSVLPGIEIKVDESACLAIKGEVTGFDWLQTHDRVTILNQTQFLYLGRVDDVINSGGLKMDPNQLKTMYMDAVVWDEDEFHVVALHDEKLGQKVVVVFQNQRERFDSAQLERDLMNLSQNVASVYLPKAIYWVENFPQTATFKLDRPALTQQLAHLQPVWEKAPNANPSQKMDRISSLTLRYQTLPDVAAPHSYSVELVLQPGSGRLPVSFEQHYFGREELPEGEIEAEGFTKDDDFAWKGTLPSVWNRILKTELNAVQLQNGEPEQLELLLVGPDGDEKKGIPTDLPGWISIAEQLTQACLEAGEKEQPMELVLGKLEKSDFFEKARIVWHFPEREVVAELLNGLKQVYDDQDWPDSHTRMQAWLEREAIDNDLYQIPTSKGWYWLLNGSIWLNKTDYAHFPAQRWVQDKVK